MSSVSHVAHGNDCDKCLQLEIASYLQTIPFSNPLISHLFDTNVFERVYKENQVQEEIDETRDLLNNQFAWHGLQADLADAGISIGKKPARIAYFYNKIGYEKRVKLADQPLSEIGVIYSFASDAFSHPDQLDSSRSLKSAVFTRLIADFLIAELDFEDAFRFIEKVIDKGHQRLESENSETLQFSELMESMIDYRHFV